MTAVVLRSDSATKAEVVAQLRLGHSAKDVSKKYDISLETLHSWLRGTTKCGAQSKISLAGEYGDLVLQFLAGSETLTKASWLELFEAIYELQQAV